MTPTALGTDIIEVARVRAILVRHGSRFKNRCFSELEQYESEWSGEHRSAERYAARFAAKEAAAKALGTGMSRGVSWRDIEVRSEPSGAPALSLGGRARAVADERGLHHWLCSLSHTAEYAVATVIATGK